MTMVQALNAALKDEATVTLLDHDGVARTGTVKENKVLPSGFFVLLPVVANGRPGWVFSTLDVAEVIFE
ncbi:RNA binding protein [Arthrobacter phage DrManhattan]|uniref:RNA binding protein n=2 Tax=Manhattanvirus drmanhattan TaxID=2734250 RepID=A0A3G2KFJ9_9CAUD|nr:hypothetical protein HOU48_gp54 [Arthrobacter phage DrManhattan]AYN57774.1 RNA binding protein [Arthrobacter phage DrManhattan]QHB36637.1 RNA binding protein [Arthrobacter phage Adolin]